MSVSTNLIAYYTWVLELITKYVVPNYLERRRPMMSWWSEHIEEAAKGSLSVTGTKQLKVI